MIETLLVALLIIVISALWSGGWLIGVYNTIVTGKNDYEGMLQDLRAEYQRRADLFLNLGKTVKSHVTFEKGTMVELAKARAGIKEGITPAKMKKLDSIFAGMKIQLEAYPELKSHTLYGKLMTEITLTEDRINQARGEMNNIAEDFNTYIEKFPTNIAAGMFHAEKMQYIELGKGADQIDAPAIGV